MLCLISVPPPPPSFPCSVALVYAYDGRVTGSAFVEFGTPDDSKQAMVKDRQMLGNRYIELFPSSREDMARATGHVGGSSGGIASSHGPPAGGGGPGPVDGQQYGAVDPQQQQQQQQY